MQSAQSSAATMVPRLCRSQIHRSVCLQRHRCILLRTALKSYPNKLGLHMRLTQSTTACPDHNAKQRGIQTTEVTAKTIIKPAIPRPITDWRRGTPEAREAGRQVTEAWRAQTGDSRTPSRPGIRRVEPHTKGSAGKAVGIYSVGLCLERARELPFELRNKRNSNGPQPAPRAAKPPLKEHSTAQRRATFPLIQTNKARKGIACASVEDTIASQKRPLAD